MTRLRGLIGVPYYPKWKDEKLTMITTKEALRKNENAIKKNFKSVT